MCGITGFITPDYQTAGTISRLTDLIRHRGPDDEGFVLFANPNSKPIVCGGLDTPAGAFRCPIPYAPVENISVHADRPVCIALGHRRLSIVDLSPLGHQPMSYADGRYWIVYNGEVYNHVELRAELEALGHCFMSHSDTEVILAAYAHWGDDCLNRFNGMFAIAIYDRLEKTLFLARDRFGVKPLYYWVSPDGAFVFASEIKQFTTFPGWEARLNGQRAYDFLNYAVTDHTDETLFEGVYQLKPGHSATIACDASSIGLEPWGRVRSQIWYALSPRIFDGSYTEACRQFGELFEDAVRLRLRADVPVGSCLSGGLDSSAIVCVMNRLLHEKNATSLQKTFSACADVARFDEKKWIDIVVAATGVQGHYVYPSLEELFSSLPQITWHQDEPFGSTSIYAQWNVFQAAKDQHVTVMLDGQGSDEQLAGYHTFFGPHLAGLFKGMRWLKLISEMNAMRRLHGYDYSRSIKYLAASTLPERIKNELKRRAGYEHSAPEWLDTRRLRAVEVNPMEMTGAAGAETVLDLSIAQLTASNIQMLLHWEDRDSMAHSIESRVPFLDYRLVEFVLGLPDDYKLSGGMTKRVLRDSMEGILPTAIQNRMDKLGFVTPEEVWLRERAPDTFRARLDQAIDSAEGVLKGKECREMLEAMIKGSQRFSFLPWRMISFGQWVETFSVKIS
jgi:asparagine synthase (glutamine-hydrolysing)